MSRNKGIVKVCISVSFLIFFTKADTEYDKFYWTFMLVLNTSLSSFGRKFHLTEFSRKPKHSVLKSLL